ncbi:hypothetical protein [Acerihabitans sp.]|uniref:hypothetical protein n=1 Tax=Acerihabitans sp. TaxID=2811394 RepID=UPI002ED8B104
MPLNAPNALKEKVLLFNIILIDSKSNGRLGQREYTLAQRKNMEYNYNANYIKSIISPPLRPCRLLQGDTAHLPDTRAARILPFMLTRRYLIHVVSIRS